MRNLLAIRLASILSCHIVASICPAERVALFTDEHVDLNVTYSGDNRFTLGFRDDDNSIQYLSDNAAVTVPELAKLSRPAGSSFDFIGVPAGAPYYRLPQGQNPQLVYLGVAAYGVAAGAIDSYDPSLESGGNATGVAPWIRLQLLGSSGPGPFSVWQSGTTPKVFVATYDGISPSDSIWIRAGSHVHFNYGFGAPGEYRLRFGVSAVKGGEPVSSCPITVFFRVDVPNDVALVRGVATFGDFVGPVENEPLEILLDAGAGLTDTQVVYASCDGSFTVHSLLRGNVDMFAKGTHWLRRGVRNIPLTDTGAGPLEFVLTNGDIDGDNSITVFDYNILSDYFDRNRTDADWGQIGANGWRPADADLDGDGVVTVFDYNILSTGFDLVGDE